MRVVRIEPAEVVHAVPDETSLRAVPWPRSDCDDKPIERLLMLA